MAVRIASPIPSLGASLAGGCTFDALGDAAAAICTLGGAAVVFNHGGG